MGSILRRLFCCCGEETIERADSYGRLSDGEDETDIVRVRHHRDSYSNSPTEEAEKAAPTSRAGAPRHDEEALNGIVSETQEGVIDVAHSDSILLSTKAYIERFNAYAKIIKAHDESAASHFVLPSPDAGWAGLPPKHQHIIDDSGSKLSDKYGRADPQAHKFSLYTQIVTSIIDAIEEIEIENKKDLVFTGFRG